MRFGDLEASDFSGALTTWNDAINIKGRRRYLLEIGSALQQDKVSSVHRSDVNASYQSENYGSATEDQSVVSDALTALTSSPAFAINATSPPREQPKITSWASLFKNNSSEQHITMPSQFSQSDTLQNESNGTAFQDPEKFKTLKDIIQRYRPFCRPQIIVPRGFINRGNMCFMNAILQPLIFCAPFYNLLHTIAAVVPHKFNVASKTPLLDALIRFMQEFSVAAEDETEVSFASPILPEYILEAMRSNEKFRSLLKGHQEDAEEYLGFLLDDLHEEFINVIKDDLQTTNGQPDSSVDQWIEVGLKKRQTPSAVANIMNVSSPITRIFGGILRSAIKVPGAKESVVIEPFHSLHLDITPDDVSDINDAIWKLVEPEVLDGYISPTAATQQEHSGETVKQALFEHLPNVLILHFKRFTFVDGQIRKVTKHISYQLEIYIPVELLTTSTRHAGPVRYSLCAVVYHHGKRAVNGHYTCDLRRGDNRWFHFDDSVVSPIAVADVIAPHNGTDRSEYLLFYQKGL